MKLFSFQKLATVIGLFFLLGTAKPAHASHGAGVDFSYTNTGGLSYTIGLTFYRDCSGINANSTWEIHCVSSCDTGIVAVTLYMQSSMELARTCPSVNTVCNGGSVQGIEAYSYTGYVTLPYACSDWEFRLFDPIEQEYGICCRNPAITNVSFASGEKLYVRATLDNLTFPGNNSTVFSNPPVIFLCDQTSHFYNPGVYDQDGDSLSFHLITPHSDTSSDVTYNLPFSGQQPISYITPTIFDSVTGDLTMHPNGIQISVMAMQVNEYRNGILVGSTERDIQLIVENCNNNLPGVSGIDGTQFFSDTLIAGDSVCFTLYSSDADSSDSLGIIWNHGIPAATFVSTFAQFPQATFCWNPTNADTSGSPYYFTVTVTDNHCPISGSNTFSYSLFVVPDTMTTNIQTPVHEQSEVVIYPNPSPGKFNFTIEGEISFWRVYNATGNCLLKGTTKPGIFDLSHFPKGIYHLEGLTSDGKRFFATIARE